MIMKDNQQSTINNQPSPKVKMAIHKVDVNNFDTSIFWNAGRTLTHNMLINVIVGGRGSGKSFGAKEYVIDNFLKKKEQFGYIRRYKEDLRKPMEQFFKDIEYKYPDFEFKVDDGKFYIRMKSEDKNQKWTQDDVAGYGFTLSTADNRKSISYPYITTLIFDEFLLQQGNQRYLKDEPITLLNLYETIARPGTPHPRVVMFMLANAISITNPYFLFWKLKMPTNQDKNGKWIWKHPTRPILVEDVRNEKFIDVKKNTEFGQLVSGTKYADYSIENKFLLDDDTFIEKKTGAAKFYFSMIYKEYTLGCWIDRREGKLYISKDYDPSYVYTYAITMRDHSPNTMFIKSRHRYGHFKIFLENFKLGNVRFEDVNVKNLTYEIIQLCMSI